MPFIHLKTETPQRSRQARKRVLASTSLTCNAFLQGTRPVSTTAPLQPNITHALYLLSPSSIAHHSLTQFLLLGVSSSA